MQLHAHTRTIPKVSVIVPIHNVEAYLARCLDSLVTQTLEDIEIICINDASSDCSPSILLRYAIGDSRIKILNHENTLGLSTCRNEGIKAAKAPYIMFCDSDDQYLPSTCEAMVSAMEQNDSDLAICNVHVIYDSNKGMRASDKLYFADNELVGTYVLTGEIISKVKNIVAWNKIYRKSIVERYEIFFPDGLLFESYPFWGEYVSVAKKVTFLQNKLYIYTRRKGSIMDYSFNKTNLKVVDYVKSCLQFHEWLSRWRLWPTRQWIFWQMFTDCTSAALTYAPNKEVYGSIYCLTDEFLEKNTPSISLGFYVSRALSLIRKHQLKEQFPQTYMSLLGHPIIQISHSLYNCIVRFAKVPVVSVSYTPAKILYRLFNRINLFKISTKNGRKNYYFLRLPLIKIKRKPRYCKIYLLCIIPIFKYFPNRIDFYRNLCNNCLFWLPSKSLRRALVNKAMSIRIGKVFDSMNFHPLSVDNSQLLEELRKLDNIVYLPNPGNLGDCLISQATYDFFESNGIKYQIYTGGEAKTIVYGGGGIWAGDLYSKTYATRLKILKEAERVVILPSSIRDCPDLVHILDKRFVVFCREKESYDYLLSQNTSAKIILDHDMAVRLSPKTLSTPMTISAEQRSLLIRMSPILRRINSAAQFLRTDDEKNNSYESHYDLSLAFGSREMNKNDTRFATVLMLLVVDLFETIITDRLHVGIAGALMGKEVYLLDNTYRKISGVYKQTLCKYPSIHMCHRLPLHVAPGSPKRDGFFQLVNKIS